MTSRIGPTAPSVTPSPSTPARAAAASASSPSAPTGWTPKAPVLNPALREKHQPDGKWVAPKGELFVNGVSDDDPIQGAVGDCYFVSGLASMAHVQPDVIEKAIRANADGTYTVTFHKDSFLGLFQRDAKKTVEVTVTAEMPTKNGQTPLYASGRDKTELWPMLMEKAWASLQGSYTRAESGSPVTVWQALTGRAGAMTSNALESEGSLFRKISIALAEHRPVASTTTLRSNSEATTGLARQHVYSVLGTTEREGQRFVTVRNPWGNTEPGSDGKNDGVFQMTIGDFKKRFGLTFFGG